VAEDLRVRHPNIECSCGVKDFAPTSLPPFFVVDVVEMRGSDTEERSIERLTAHGPSR